MSVFLTLAFILPAILYLMVGGLLFRDFYSIKPLVSFFSKLGPGVGIFLGIAAVVGVGLALTSVTFLLEYHGIRSIPVVKHHFPPMGFKELAVLQARGSNVSLLTQQAGQAIMHLNLWVGFLLGGIVYLMIYGVNHYMGTPVPFRPWSLLLVFVLVVGHYHAAYRYFRWARAGIQESAGLQQGVPEGQDPPAQEPNGPGE